MTDLRKAAEMALEFIVLASSKNRAWFTEKEFEVVAALRQALAQQEPDEFCTATTEELMKELGCSDEKAKEIHNKVEALAQPEQEPVVHPVVHLWDCICEWVEMVANDGKDANLTPPDWLVDAVKAATAPPKQWAGLRDDEIGWVWHYSPPNSHEYARAIEAKLKEKNT